MQKILFFLTLLLFQSHGKEINRDFFKDKPRSLVKDFYISQYLDQNISSNDASSLIGEVKNMNWKLFYKFANKIDDFSFKRVAYCKQLPPSLFKGKDADCIKIGLSNYKATKLSPKDLINIANLIHYKYPHDSQILNLIAKRDFTTLSNSPTKQFLNIFNSVGNKFRQKYYNHDLNATLLNKFSNKYAFNTSIQKIVYDPKLIQLQKSILKFDSSKLNAQSNFLLGINALKLQHEDIAQWYFKVSQKNAKQNFQRDRAIFWQYLIKRDKSLLKKLILESKDINIYTLFAYEKLDLFPKNIYTSIEPKLSKAPFDITDPFVWLKIQDNFKKKHFKDYETKKLNALKLNSLDTQPHVARLIYKFSQNKHYFFLAYKRYIKDLQPKRKALIFALARQESRFIPTDVSYSYALGLMQFMPFVAKAIAKQQGYNDFKYEDMFNPEVAYNFANIHIDYLQKHLFHPLLIAYAYNGGVGYTRRNIIQNPTTFTKHKYEPFLTMELLPNAQAREYGKKVLVNYVIYAHLLGIKDISLLTLLQKLTMKTHISDF